MKQKCKGCFAQQIDEEFGEMCTASVCIQDYDYDAGTRSWTPKYKPRTDSCMQRVYCSECFAFPMGLGCPNIKEIKKHKKIVIKNRLMDKRRFDLNQIRKEIKRLRKWKSSLSVRYTHHAQEKYKVKNNG